MTSLGFMLLLGLVSMTVSERRNGPPPGRRGPHPRGPPPRGGPCGPEGPGGPGGPGGPEGPGGPRGPGGPGECLMFPSCKNFSRAIHEEVHAMHERGEGGPENCPDENHEACRWNDVMKARCNVKEQLAVECMQEMSMFMNAECPAINEAYEQTTSGNP